MSKHVPYSQISAEDLLEARQALIAVRSASQDRTKFPEPQSDFEEKRPKSKKIARLGAKARELRPEVLAAIEEDRRLSKEIQKKENEAWWISHFNVAVQFTVLTEDQERRLNAAYEEMMELAKQRIANLKTLLPANFYGNYTRNPDVATVLKDREVRDLAASNLKRWPLFFSNKEKREQNVANLFAAGFKEDEFQAIEEDRKHDKPGHISDVDISGKSDGQKRAILARRDLDKRILDLMKTITPEEVVALASQNGFLKQEVQEYGLYSFPQHRDLRLLSGAVLHAIKEDEELEKWLRDMTKMLQYANKHGGTKVYEKADELVKRANTEDPKGYPIQIGSDFLELVKKNPGRNLTSRDIKQSFLERRAEILQNIAEPADLTVIEDHAQVRNLNYDSTKYYQPNLETPDSQLKFDQKNMHLVRAVLQAGFLPEQSSAVFHDQFRKYKADELSRGRSQEEIDTQNKLNESLPEQKRKYYLTTNQIRAVLAVRADERAKKRRKEITGLDSDTVVTDEFMARFHDKRFKELNPESWEALQEFYEENALQQFQFADIKQVGNVFNFSLEAVEATSTVDRSQFAMLAMGKVICSYSGFDGSKILVKPTADDDKVFYLEIDCTAEKLLEISNRVRNCSNIAVILKSFEKYDRDSDNLKFPKAKIVYDNGYRITGISPALLAQLKKDKVISADAESTILIPDNEVDGFAERLEKSHQKLVSNLFFFDKLAEGLHKFAVVINEKGKQRIREDIGSANDLRFFRRAQPRISADGELEVVVPIAKSLLHNVVNKGSNAANLQKLASQYFNRTIEVRENRDDPENPYELVFSPDKLGIFSPEDLDRIDDHMNLCAQRDQFAEVVGRAGIDVDEGQKEELEKAELLIKEVESGISKKITAFTERALANREYQLKKASPLEWVNLAVGGGLAAGVALLDQGVDWIATNTVGKLPSRVKDPKNFFTKGLNVVRDNIVRPVEFGVAALRQTLNETAGSALKAIGADEFAQRFIDRAEAVERLQKERAKDSSDPGLLTTAVPAAILSTVSVGLNSASAGLHYFAETGLGYIKNIWEKPEQSIWGKIKKGAKLTASMLTIAPTCVLAKIGAGTLGTAADICAKPGEYLSGKKGWTEYPKKMSDFGKRLREQAKAQAKEHRFGKVEVTREQDFMPYRDDEDSKEKRKKFKEEIKELLEKTKSQTNRDALPKADTQRFGAVEDITAEFVGVLHDAIPSLKHAFDQFSSLDKVESGFKGDKKNYIKVFDNDLELAGEGDSKKHLKVRLLMGEDGNIVMVKVNRGSTTNTPLKAEDLDNGLAVDFVRKLRDEMEKPLKAKEQEDKKRRETGKPGVLGIDDYVEGMRDPEEANETYYQLLTKAAQKASPKDKDFRVKDGKKDGLVSDNVMECWVKTREGATIVYEVNKETCEVSARNSDPSQRFESIKNITLKYAKDRTTVTEVSGTMKSAFDLVANRAGGESTPAKLIGDIPGTSPKGASARSLMGHALQTAILGG